MTLPARILMKIATVVLLLFVAVPLIGALGLGLMWSLGRLFSPIAALAVFGLFIWGTLEAIRRIDRRALAEAVAAAPAAPAADFDEADVRLVLEAKDDVGRLRMLVDSNGAVLSTQLISLAAAADSLLNTLPHAPEVLTSARPLLMFHLPRTVAAALGLRALTGSACDEAAERLATAAALLANALSQCRAGAKLPDVVAVDRAVQALNVRLAQGGPVQAIR